MVVSWFSAVDGLSVGSGRFFLCLEGCIQWHVLCFFTKNVFLFDVLLLFISMYMNDVTCGIVKILVG